jgi:hypothetical protein
MKRNNCDELGLFFRSSVTDARHRQQRQYMRHVIFADDHNLSSAQGHHGLIQHLVFFAVGHPDDKRNAFANRGLHLISCHNSDGTISRSSSRRQLSVVRRLGFGIFQP